MSLPASGPISMLNLQEEFGGTNPIAINEYYRGGPYVSNALPVPVAGNPIALDAFYGTSSSAVQGGIFKNLRGSGLLHYTYANGTWYSFENVSSSPDYIYRSVDLKTSVKDTTLIDFSTTPYIYGFAANERQNILTADALYMPIGGRICRSTDGGANWTMVIQGGSGGNMLTGVSGTLYGSQVMAFYASGSLDGYITQDGGQSWQLLPIGSGRAAGCNVVFCPGLGLSYGGDGLFVHAGQYGMYYSPEAKTWSMKNTYDSQTGNVITNPNLGHPGYSTATGNGTVVSISLTGQPVLPTNGTVQSFTRHPRLPNAHATAFNGVAAFGNGYFLVVGKTSLAAPQDVGAWTSTDGVSWSYHMQLPLTGLVPNTLDYVNGKFYAQMTNGSAWAVNA